jgi:hypothetical protein
MNIPFSVAAALFRKGLQEMNVIQLIVRALHEIKYRVFKKFSGLTPMSTNRQLFHRQPAVHTEESTYDKAKHPTPLTDKDTSTISSGKGSSARSGHMEQRLFLKISRRDDLQCRKIHLKLLELDDDDALSYSEVCCWSWQFLMGREYIENKRRTDRPSDFTVQLRIQTALEEVPFASVQCINEATHTPATTEFYILAEVLCLRFCPWRWAPHLLSDGQKAGRARRALMLLAALRVAEKRRWSNFWTGD